MLPDARIVELTGHGHNAVFSGPQLVAKEVLTFLEGLVEAAIRES